MAANPFSRPGQGGTGPLPADATRAGTAADGVPWPAWLDTDTFDGLGEEAWLASLADQEPELADLADAELERAEPGEWADMANGTPDMANGTPGPSAPSLRAPDPRGPGVAGRPQGGPDAGFRLGAAGEPQGGPDAGFGPGGTAESMAPGVPLCELTEGAIADGLASMSDAAVVGVVSASRRLQRRAEWLELQATREFARRRWETERVPVKDENGRWRLPNSAAEQAPAELAHELTEDRSASEDRMDLSLALRDRLPRMDALLAAGRLDERRCRGVRDMTAPLSDEDARMVDQMLAEDAAELRYSQLLKRAAKLALMLDPESARERKERATRRKARVERFPEKSGNFAFAGRELPVEEVLASEAHIRDLARYLRANGVPGALRVIEVMCFLDLTQGRDPRDRIPGHGTASPDGPASQDSEAAQGAWGKSGYGDSRDEPKLQCRDWRQEEGWRQDEWDDYDSDDDEDGDDGEGDGGGRGGKGPGSGGGSGSGGGPWPFSPPGPGKPGGRAPFPATINLLVPVGTGWGWSTMPGEAGRDIIDPPTLQDMMQAASRHPRTRWCVTLIGDDRTAVAHGCARGRHAWDPPPDPDSGPDPGEETSASNTRDAGRVPRARGGAPTPGQLAHLAEFLARLKIHFEPIAKGTGDDGHREDRYRPSRLLRHLILARNATCPAPGCGASSLHVDLDHTIPWPEGSTDEFNLGPPCRRDHRTKQAPGWKLEQPEPGVFTWTTPSGRSYTTRPTRYDV